MSESKRVLVRWNDDHDKELLLWIVYCCSEAGIKIPFDKVAFYMGSNFSSGAVVQHLAKVRTKMEENGLHVPPAAKRGIVTKAPSSLYRPTRKSYKTPQPRSNSMFADDDYDHGDDIPIRSSRRSSVTGSGSRSQNKSRSRKSRKNSEIKLEHASDCEMPDEDYGPRRDSGSKRGRKGNKDNEGSSKKQKNNVSNSQSMRGSNVSSQAAASRSRNSDANESELYRQWAPPPYRQYCVGQDGTSSGAALQPAYNNRHGFDSEEEEDESLDYANAGRSTIKDQGQYPPASSQGAAPSFSFNWESPDRSAMGNNHLLPSLSGSMQPPATQSTFNPIPRPPAHNPYLNASVHGSRLQSSASTADTSESVDDMLTNHLTGVKDEQPEIQAALNGFSFNNELLSGNFAGFAHNNHETYSPSDLQSSGWHGTNINGLGSDTLPDLANAYGCDVGGDMTEFLNIGGYDGGNRGGEHE